MNTSRVARRPLGTSGLSVPVLGLGCGPLGDFAFDERDAVALIERALDRGVDLFDAARSYGDAEARLGRALRERRDAVILSTKVGYGIDGVPDWTGECIRAGVERALGMLCTDRIDIVHLHSCGRAILERGEVVRALEEAVRAGKVRVAAYSGEEGDLDAAVATGVFGSVQISVSPWDQRALRHRVPSFAERGIGVIAKRPLANAPWRFAERPEQPDFAEYYARFERLAIDPAGLPYSELALRFAAYAPGVSCAIMGTRSLAHLDAAADAVLAGPLDAELDAHIREAFDQRGADFGGVV